MPWYEFLVFFAFLFVFCGIFGYALINETKSNCKLRKRMIQHMDNIEYLLCLYSGNSNLK